MHAVTGTGRLIAGRYRLQGPVGRGAMGIVWRGRDELLDRDVAVKQVQITALTLPAEAEVAYQRTLREARTAARLSHPAVVTVFDVVEEDGSPWIIMEFIGGRSLEQVIAEDGPLPPLHAAELGARLLGALETAHAAGVLHRDVKPSNVLISADGRAVLSDFGIATFAEDPGITQAGMVVGTPGFTAPERVRGGSATPASDLWSLGATLYAAVEGRGPFERPGGSMAIIAGVAAEDAPRAPSAGPLTPVIEALLSRDPAQRPDAAGTSALLADAVAAGTVTRPVAADPGYNSLGYNSQGRDSRGRDSMSYSQHIQQHIQPGPQPHIQQHIQPGTGPASDPAAGLGLADPGHSTPAADGPGAADLLGGPGPTGLTSVEPELGPAGPGVGGPAGAVEAVRPDPAHAASFLDPPDFARLRMPGPGDDLAGMPESLPPDTAAPDPAGYPQASDAERTAGLPEFMDPPKAAGIGGPGDPAGPAAPPPPAGAPPTGSRLSMWSRHWRFASAGGAIAAIVVAAVIGLGVYSGSLAAGSPAPDAQSSSSGPGTSVTARTEDTPRPGTGARPTAGARGAPGGAGPGGAPSPSRSIQPSQGTSATPTTSPTHPASGGHGSKSPGPGRGLGQAPAGYQWQPVKAATLGTTAGFAIAAPDGWQLKTTGKTAYLAQPGGHGRVAISLHPWRYADAMREARYLQKIAQGNDLGYQFGAVRPTDFMSVTAAVSRFSWQPAGRSHRTTVLSELVTLATAAGVQPYQMTLSVGAPYLAASRPVYEKMLSTFQPLT